MSYTVRNAKLEDAKALAGLGKVLHAESAFAHMNFETVMVERFLHYAMTQENNWWVQVIVGDDDVPVGGMVAEIVTTFFGEDCIAEDRTLMIAPEHRTKCSSALTLLVSNYFVWASSKGAKRIFLATSTGVDPEKTEKVYEALGFHKVGTIHEA